MLSYDRLQHILACLFGAGLILSGIMRRGVGVRGLPEVSEQCAAGFPYLLQDDRDTFEDTLRKFPAARRVRKVLVADVGAGSWDAGYLLRTVRPRDSKGVMRFLLIWLPAADTLELAGRWL